MRVAKLAKLQRSVDNLAESFRGVNLNAFQSLTRAIYHIEAARKSESARLSVPKKKAPPVDIRALMGF